jgi:hypothetical protein
MTQLQLFRLIIGTNVRLLMLGVFGAFFSLLGVAHAQTVLWSENFDDGNGNNRWYADEGVWQIGSPTIGPATNSAGYRTHSGPDCATTGLTENYPGGMNSRLIRIQTFTVPAASQWPRLCFWQWRSFSGNDYGVVEIRIGTTGAWQAVSPQYVAYSTDWTYTSVDLGAFAGQTVQLAFHAVYVDGNGAAPGWYVDDISFMVGAPVFTNPEGFEEAYLASGLGASNVYGWYADNGTWEVGSSKKSGGAPANSLGAQAHSGTNCAVTLLNANYPTDMNSRFISPYFVLPPAGAAPYLRFWHWYNFSGNDYGVVEIRVGTNAWQPVSPPYTGNSENWTEPFIDLTGFGGQTVQLALYAVYVDGNGAAPGWYVDDVQVLPYTTAATNPYVNIVLSKTNVVMNWTWLANYAGFTLQSTTNLPASPTNWSTVLPAPSIISGLNVVTNPASGTQKYFRLKQ